MERHQRLVEVILQTATRDIHMTAYGMQCFKFIFVVISCAFIPAVIGCFCSTCVSKDQFPQ